MICSIRRPPRSAAATIFVFAVASCSPEMAFGSAFQNLNFESAAVGTPLSNELPTPQAMPGWATDNSDSGYVAYDDVSTGGTGVSIQDGLSPWGFVVMHPIQGSYSALLATGDYGSPYAWISQTGDIPSNANSLMFSTEFGGTLGMTVSLNGTVIPLSLYSVGPVVNSLWGPVDTYIGDIRQFTGQQNVALQFTGSGPLDAIQFSPLIVPEPSMLVLLGTSVLLLLGCCWRHAWLRRTSDSRQI